MTGALAHLPAIQGAPILHAERLGKEFGGVTVLSDVTLDIRPGEIHAIIGENGAGKSTLMRLLSGYLRPSEGGMLMDGEPVAFHTPSDAQAAGIALVHQEILLAEALTVTENIFIGREMTRFGRLDERAMREAAAAQLAEIGCKVSPRALVRDISLANRQLVQIAKALLGTHRVVIFDEPTAVLTHDEVDPLLDIIIKLKQRGVAILYISHRLDEVERLADRVTVLRDGRRVGTYDAEGLTPQRMASLMVGREFSSLYPPKLERVPGEPALEIEHAHVPGFVNDVSFTLRKGEILGLAGMIGAGRTELFEGLLGLRAASFGGVRLHGRPVHFHSPADAARAGLGYLTEDRKGKGLLLGERLAPNLTLAALDRVHPFAGLDLAGEARQLDQAVRHYDIRLRSLDAKAGQLSGGNQQKLLLAKVMLNEPSVLVIDEPTRGIDIANKSQIYAFIQSLVREGRSCIVISSEMQELIGLCDRILVMRSGRINGELTGDAMSESNVALYATSSVASEEISKGNAHG
ncbi:monosaccharide ABC transporter ATP-binding protein (CUT2 family) [Ancylobacter aquaticus]|uniref:Monosaccharide ABC transporter ATP-binding protein (CUT2 family) n=1 Tax=Ancylobacter aquaticus TaxID=100 RepID=A0A4R1I782_ANCAQ|nr:sugar ABC transporter ATP-binding protein [Ancylobacter aquaticus]TCK30848.1 monosaccharide ABC transporter ATP-binding protein (CUT2 family) [Ancylobacter aquaticus]